MGVAVHRTAERVVLHSGTLGVPPIDRQRPLLLDVVGWASCTANDNPIGKQFDFSIEMTIASDGRFSFEGPTSKPDDPQNVLASVSGRLSGTTLSGVVRVRGEVLELSGARCTFDTANTAFTSMCTSGCAVPAPKPPAPKPGEGSRAGDGRIVPFRSIGGAALGITLGQLKTVLGRPTIGGGAAEPTGATTACGSG